MIKIIATAGEEDLVKIQNLDTEFIDILEIRLDLCSKKFIKTEMVDKLRIWPKPLLFTYRLKEDSSEKKHTIMKFEYVSLILEIFNSSYNLVDIEVTNDNSIFNYLPESKYKRIYSYHDFKGYPSLNTMKQFISNIQESTKSNQNIYKFAVLPDTTEEDMKFLESVKLLSKEYEIAVIIMGERGVYSRIFGDLFGSSYTYACLNEPRAPGQIKARDIKKFRILSGIDSESTKDTKV